MKPKKSKRKRARGPKIVNQRNSKRLADNTKANEFWSDSCWTEPPGVLG
jgi:hypothetical protein